MDLVVVSVCIELVEFSLRLEMLLVYQGLRNQFCSTSR